jgi:hypothetical protein
LKKTRYFTLSIDVWRMLVLTLISSLAHLILTNYIEVLTLRAAIGIVWY